MYNLARHYDTHAAFRDEASTTGKRGRRTPAASTYIPDCSVMDQEFFCGASTSNGDDLDRQSTVSLEMEELADLKALESSDLTTEDDEKAAEERDVFEDYE